MVPQGRAIGTTVIALVLIAVISASAIGFVTIYSQSTGPRPASDWYIVKSNVTVHGLPAIIGMCESIASSCPIGAEPSNASLIVELVNYKSTYYYAYSGQIINGGIITMTRTNSTGGTNVTTVTQTQTTITYTAWFTNSTLYCVTPSMSTAPITCPS